MRLLLPNRFLISMIYMLKERLSLKLKVLKPNTPKILFFCHLNVNLVRNKFVSIQKLITFGILLISKLRLMVHFQMRNIKLKVRNVLRKIEMPLEEDFSFTLMKSISV